MRPLLLPDPERSHGGPSPTATHAEPWRDTRQGWGVGPYPRTHAAFSHSDLPHRRRGRPSTWHRPAIPVVADRQEQLTSITAVSVVSRKHACGGVMDTSWHGAKASEDERRGHQWERGALALGPAVQ